MGYQVDTTEDNGGSQDGVEWDALHAHMVECLKAEKPKTRKGTIVGIVHFGDQPQEPTKYLLDPSNAIQKKNLANADKTGAKIVHMEEFYDNGKTIKNVDVVVTPVKDWTSFAYVVEFPKFKVNKGQFFEGMEDEDKPYQILMAHPWFYEGTLDDKNVMTYQRLFTKKNFKDAKTGKWGYKPNHTINKMAEAAELLEEGEAFNYSRRGELLGKTFQFRLQVYINSDGYYHETIKYVGALSEDDEMPEVDSESLFGLDFHRSNDPDTIANLHPLADKVLISTMRVAANFEGSAMEADLREAGKLPENATGTGEKAPVQDSGGGESSGAGDGAQAQGEPNKNPVDDFDDDIPF